MTSFADTWNSAYEGLPADNENISLGANRIRDFKVNIRERVQVDHSFNGDANDGAHVHCTFLPLASDPTVAPPNAFLYAKTLNTSITELFFEDNAGDITQLTVGGRVNTQPFPSGTSMLFCQAVPPVGWTQQNNNDAMIRVVNDTSGGGTGGSWTISGASVSTSTSTSTTLNSISLSTSINSVSMSLAMNAVTLGATNLPAHQHNVTAAFNTAGTGIATSGGGTSITNTGLATDGGIGLNATPFTPTGSVNFNSGSASTTLNSSSLSSASSSSSAFSNDGTWRPAYLNVLRASKS